MSFTKKVSFIIGFFMALSPRAQEDFTGFWQPQFAINYKLSQTYAHNFSLSYRTFFLEEDDFNLRGRQLDLTHFSKLNIKDNQSIALGIQYRFRDIFDDGPNELRFTQQYNFKARPMTVRYGHRLRAEQRITRIRTTHRFRYRFALDFPLKGQKLNIGEPYFIGSLEQLLSLAQGSSSQYDIRLNTQLGWQLDKGFKFQTGIEYRFENYTSDSLQNILFLMTSVQLSL